MRLYTISVRHVAPKDWHESIHCYAIADSEEQVYEELSKLSYWNYKEDEGETYTIYDDDCNAIGEESWRERMMRFKGEINEPDPDYSDAYYGVTVYGWDEGKNVTEAELETLKQFVKVVDLRGE